MNFRDFIAQAPEEVEVDAPTDDSYEEDYSYDEESAPESDEE